MNTPMFNGREIRIVLAAQFNKLYGGLETFLYTRIALSVLKKYPVDMLVFEMTEDGFQRVRLAGYNFLTQELDETTVAYKAKSLETEKFWFKVEDYGEFYLGTFMLVGEY
jgi:hypothetical protein